MSKDELEKDVRTYLRQQFGLNGGGMVSCDLKKLLLGFTEPREKRIEELEKENEIFKKANEIIAQQRDGRDVDISILEKRNVELIDKVMELEAQIEKMKCCSNCVYLAGCDLSGYEECKNFDKWELREIEK